jgi:hypothetical protein
MDWQPSWSDTAKQHVTLKIYQLTMLFQNCCRLFTAVREVRATNTQEFGVCENEMVGWIQPTMMYKGWWIDTLCLLLLHHLHLLLHTAVSCKPGYQELNPSESPISIKSVFLHRSKYSRNSSEMATLFRFLSLLIIASSLALCTPLGSPVFEAEKSLEKRQHAVIAAGKQRSPSQCAQP